MSTVKFTLPTFITYFTVYNIKTYEEFTLILKLLKQAGCKPKRTENILTPRLFRLYNITSLHIDNSGTILQSDYTKPIESNNIYAGDFIKLYGIKPITIRTLL